ncbi:MAG: hypothetical protein CMJ83_09705 [Planctomycetes bacterium]|nr:hypothetical protein [Planctomycetota bacterium]
MLRLPSFGIQRRIGRWARRTVGRLLGPSTVLAKLYVPDRAPAGAPDETLDLDPDETGGEDEGLPLPPAKLTLAWNSDLAEYVASGRDHATAVRRVLEEQEATLGAGDALMDWGCGTGRVLRHFAGEAEQAEAWGVDVDARGVSWAKRHLSPPFRFVTGTSYPHLPFPDETFSLVFGVSVMTHLEHLRDAWVMEIRRVLRPGGLAILSVHDEHTLAHLQQHGPVGAMGLPEDLAPLMDRDVTVVQGAEWNLTFTFLHSDHIRREWGCYLDVVDLKPMTFGVQTAVVLRR